MHRLSSRAAMLLLARVAMAPEREHPRDEMPSLAQALAHAPADGLAYDAVLLVLQSSWGEISRCPPMRWTRWGSRWPHRASNPHAWRMDRNAERARACTEEAPTLARELQRPNTEASLLSLEGHLLTVVDRNPHQGLRQGELAAQTMAAAETQW